MPNSPSNLVASTISATQINLTWTDNSNNEQGFYIEQKSGSGAFSQIAQVNSNVATYSATGLTPSTSYTYRVRAYNTSGSSAYTAESTTSTSPTANFKQMIMASGHVGRTVVSCDGGLTWIRDRSDNNAVRCWINGNPNYVECDHTPNSGRGLDFGDGNFYANFGWGYNGSIRRSSDGVNWTTIRTGGWGGGVLYHSGTIWSQWNSNTARSVNSGNSWIPSYNLVSNIIGPTAYRAGSLFFVVDYQQNFALSRDLGVSWETHNISRDHARFFVAGAGVHLIAGGSSVSRSTNNGMTWTSQPNAISGSFVGLVFTGTQFVGWTQSARWISSNGTSWSQTPLQVSGTLPIGHPIVYNSQTQTYSSIPNHWDQYYDKQKAYYSTDGINWTQLSSTAFKGGHPINDMIVGTVPAENCL